ncbi:putative DNA helicase [Kyrpidia tusciae DSM 2912]|uniref:DNA helicase n=1 Tax=Kyrpidia tusciae (strain DSM 2912 / NBRC 15312 / T2) TaxID=562970 RepID=D5WUD5_KYRT2|nr:putative DNA helicase [Kyrpidia tusciae DSM 2912]
MCPLEEQALIEFKLVYCKTVNYALQQNRIPVIREVYIRNLSSRDLHGVTVCIRNTGGFADEWSTSFDLIPAGESIVLGPVDLRVSPGVLAELTERLAEELQVSVLQGETVLHIESFPIDLLAFDEWGGLTALPEMISAFVTPNHPEVRRLIRTPADILGQWISSPSFDGYQSQDPNRARMQVAAIYHTIQKEGFTYAVLPPSFQESGQRVRLPDTMSTYRMGNCLDITLLFAACLEAAGLHPLIVFVQGHAFVGAWLVKETFPESVQDDISLLRKRLADGVGEICVVESTALTSKPPVPFEQAERLAQIHLMEEEKFVCFVDVARSRADGIRPLPLRVKTDAGWTVEEDTVQENVEFAVPRMIDIFKTPVENDQGVHPKQREWERRLLDLSLRNLLLNFRGKKSTIPLLISELDVLEDVLSQGREFELHPVPGFVTENPQNPQHFRQIQPGSQLAQIVQQELEHGRLRADLSEVDLKDRCVHIYRSAKLSLEEHGANTLYLALGFLKWFETDVSEKPRYAPMVMVPIDIVRKHRGVGFTVRRRDEETQFNITLLELMKQDHGIVIEGLDPLPRDESGIHLRKVFTHVRQMVMNKRRWDVEERACIGLFSFGQFVMWNDLRNRTADLVKNPVVASLMSGKLEWQPLGVFDRPDRLEDTYSPDQLFVPIGADASQFRAVAAAHEGESFVLHGPPGTGKSQTITNIIADALAQGKTVLFVAAKMAALTVVQRRLSELGLGPFCLELHSTKNNKRAVLDQLRVALEQGKVRSEVEWQEEAERLGKMRAELSRHARALHRKHSHGLSIYDAITLFDRDRNAPDVVHVDGRLVDRMSVDQMQAYLDAANELRIAGEVCGGPWDHPLKEIQRADYSAVLKSQAEDALRHLEQTLDACKSALHDLVRALDWNGAPSLALEEAELLHRLCTVLLDAPEVSAQFITSGDWKNLVENLRRVSEHGVNRDSLRADVYKDYFPEVLEFDAASVLREWQEAGRLGWMSRTLRRARIAKRVKPFLAKGGKPDKNRLERDLMKIVHLQEEERAVREWGAKYSELLGANLWNDGEADWEAVRGVARWREKLARIFDAFAAQPSGGVGLQEGVGRLFRDGTQAFLEQQGSTLKNFMAVKEELEQSRQRVFELLQIDLSEDLGRGERADWIRPLQQKTRTWLGNIGGLREWCTFRKVRNKLVDMGLASLVQAYENGTLQNDQIVPSFRRALYKACVESMLHRTPELAEFSSQLFEERIGRFTRMVDQYEDLTRQEIAARLARLIPNPGEKVHNSSELGVLMRAIRGHGRGVSLRNLFGQIPNVLNRVCPCMLMSPISVAQYLDPAAPPFDLVIFDEASQVPTCEAVGAMARGRNVIVVGDPNQLPPTSFFTSTNRDSEDKDLSEDLESVLDDCLAIGMPQGFLLWHYRSRREGLISFSNRHYYDNKLLTFPSPDELVPSVKRVHVDGFYDRGRTKQNRAEAVAVVDEILRRLRDPELRKHSIGVVTFNLPQKNLIEDLLDEAFAREPDLESVAAGMHEPLLIKNLENVQGDERDVILFSIGYGPDETGHVTMNFGPLNREGGWRRLNVAVSRAREEMIVFSTLRPEHMEGSRIHSRGVAGLKAFLEYAERGRTALALPVTSQARLADGLERNVAERLRGLGYSVHEHVGTSGFRVDLAIVDPRDPGRYLLGILADGHTYHRADMTRDREVLRPRMLNQLGWNIYRIWSMDWWENLDMVLQGIQQAIREAETKTRQPGATRVQQTDEPAKGKNGQLQPATFDAPISRQESDPGRAINQQSSSALADPVLRTTKGKFAVYQPVVLERVPFTIDDFFAESNTRLIKEQLSKVIEGEGPISCDLLYRRVLGAWGIKRIGHRLRMRLDEIVKHMRPKCTVQDQTPFFWPRDVDPATYMRFRISEGDAERRDAADLPVQEVASAVQYILEGQISLPKEQLIRELARLFGYQRLGSAVETALERGVHEAIERGLVRWEPDRERVVYKGDMFR